MVEELLRTHHYYETIAFIDNQPSKGSLRRVDLSRTLPSAGPGTPGVPHGTEVTEEQRSLGRTFPL